MRSKLHKLLNSKSLDFETVTINQVVLLLEEDLGLSLEEYREFIKEEIDAFLLAQDIDDGYAPEGQDAERPSKKLKATPVPAINDLRVTLSSKRFLQLRYFNGRPLVDIREWYEKEGELAPGLKGLSLTPEQYMLLVAGLPDLNSALERQDDSIHIPLGGNRRASISTFNGKMMVDLREFYEKDGKMLPGKKGISLPPDQWTILTAVAEQILAALPDKERFTSRSPVKEEPATSPPKDCSAEEGVVDLGNSRRAEVSAFNGRLLVSIREFYEKDGKMLPGKKGISLTPDQFYTIVVEKDQVTNALLSGDTDYSLALHGGKKRVAISSFRGKYFVNIREYYEDKETGEEKPGKTGISLNEEQWKVLELSLGGLKERLTSHTTS